ncbi:hypothetical protein [Methylobacterium sp. SyP6R]|uniref:hypothetical protein n=1 Tax=Methylobacterium sp. SyP6R TaxID=2718876 RepID=UPI001F3FC3BB|nr:hypothetical protein [Methylobacterium sp. SyP6R]MCF4128999.1 hypothetical protein [Methylobacterium sp. SyP6R]
MLFATPLVREQVKLDPRYADAETITNDDLAKIALERRGLRDLELMRHVNAMLGELGDGAIAFRLYNASDERLWLHRDSYTGEASIAKYPPDYIIDPGQWSVVIAKGIHSPSGVVFGKLVIAYRGGDSGLITHWLCPAGECAVAMARQGEVPAKPQPRAISQDGRVAAITRGYLGDTIVVDGLYTTKTQYPFV